jgi:hypothetical protein
MPNVQQILEEEVGSLSTVVGVWKLILSSFVEIYV